MKADVKTWGHFKCTSDSLAVLVAANANSSFDGGETAWREADVDIFKWSVKHALNNILQGTTALNTRCSNFKAHNGRQHEHLDGYFLGVMSSCRFDVFLHLDMKCERRLQNLKYIFTLQG